MLFRAMITNFSLFFTSALSWTALPISLGSFWFLQKKSYLGNCHGWTTVFLRKVRQYRWGLSREQLSLYFMVCFGFGFFFLFFFFCLFGFGLIFFSGRFCYREGRYPFNGLPMWSGFVWTNNASQSLQSVFRKRNGKKKKNQAGAFVDLSIFFCFLHWSLHNAKSFHFCICFRGLS